MKLSFYIVTIFLISLNAFSQGTIGSWQEYIAVNDVFQVQSMNNKVYAVAKTGYFVVDIEENVMTKRTRINGLNDISISAMIVVPGTEKIIIGYTNGNIDIIQGDQVRNVPDLKLKQLTSTKTINNITIIDNKAFLSTDFGIVVLDYNNYEISDTYYIGDNATDLKVNEITTFNDTIYAATDKGLLSAPENSNALNYYGTWENRYPLEAVFTAVTSYNNGVISVIQSGSSYKEAKYSAGAWNEVSISSNFVKYQKSNNTISSIYKNKIQVYTENHTLIKNITTYNIEDKSLSPNFSALTILNNKYWIGDSSYGLIEKEEMIDYQHLPNGPISNVAYKIAASPNYLYSVPGVVHENSWTPTSIPAQLSILENGEWIHINNETVSELQGKSNFCDIAIDPTKENKVYIASRYGIYEFLNNEVSNHYTHENSPMENAGSWDLINGVTIDNKGNLYANNQSQFNPILVKPADISSSNATENYGWYKYDYFKFYAIGETPPWYNPIFYTSQGYIWTIGKHFFPGLYVFDTNNTLDTDLDDNAKGPINNSEDPRGEYFTFWDENGSVIDVDAECLAEDKDGYVWVGTSSGVLVYYRPYSIFEDEKPIASRIKISRNDGSGLADYLLENERVTAITVDGANRKWIGTDKSGVYLVSSDGTETIHHFTVDNSPLLSNYINSIAIDAEQGLVYFATSNGIVSYRSDATEGKEDYSDVYAFPNPVKPNYAGNITITGLMEESTIRITNISGRVVYQAASTGGQVVWNGKNIYNESVKSGVYIVYATNKDGSESIATKIMVIK